jgi:phosphoribosylformylglycinamidine synthase
MTELANPNGSLNSIAGICNAARNVAGLMPHPERASEVILGCEDGRLIFESLFRAFDRQDHRQPEIAGSKPLPVEVAA